MGGHDATVDRDCRSLARPELGRSKFKFKCLFPFTIRSAACMSKDSYVITLASSNSP